MELEWEESLSGNWRLIDRSNGYKGHIAVAIAHRTAGEDDWFAGIVFGRCGYKDLDVEIHDVVFREERPLAEMKALLETTVALRGHGDGV